MNNKGFMMAEVIVVASIVMVVLGAFYASYSGLYSAYSTRIDYYDVRTLYELGAYRDQLIETDELNPIITSNSNTVIVKSNLIRKTDGTFCVKTTAGCTNADSENYQVIIVPNRKRNLDSGIKSSASSLKFKDYVVYLSGAVTLDSNFVMLMERCQKDNEDDCKYAYLEVYNGTE